MNTNKVKLSLVAMAITFSFACEDKTNEDKAEAVSKDAYCGEETEINNTSQFAGFIAMASGLKADFPTATICYQMKSDNKVEIKLTSSVGSTKLSGSYAKSGNRFSIDVTNNEVNNKSYTEFMVKYMRRYYDVMFDGLCDLAENPKKCKKEIANSPQMKQMNQMFDNLSEMGSDKYSKYSGDFLLVGNSLHTLTENCDYFKSFTKKGSAASTAFCSYGTIYDKCGEKAYDLKEQKCENNIVLTKCGDGWYTNEQFCSNGVVKNYDFITDSRDSRKYKTVKIGAQTWMAENLNYAGKNDDIGSCYEKKTKNCEEYGALYTWDEAVKSCPTGWHLPSDEEWETLVNFAGGKEIAAKKLRAKETNCKYTKKEQNSRGNVTKVEHDNCNTDEFGFSALLGGFVDFIEYTNFNFGNQGVGEYGKWWTATKSVSSGMHTGSIGWKIGTSVSSGNSSKTSLYSVRCVSDLSETKAVPSKTQATSTESLENSRDNNTVQIGAKTYKTVKIGTQTWMAENSNKTTHPGSSKCYNNNESNCQKYGRLYTWSGAKYACPEGWHLPSNNEWQTLIDFAGGDKVAGKILKAKSGWDGSGNGADNFGFAALPGGVGLSNGDFRDAGNGGLWWSSTEDDTKKAYRRSMDINSADVHRSSSDKNLLFSVRCVENNEGDAIRGDGADGNDGLAIAELEQEAKKWKNSSANYKTRESQFFSFKGIVKMSPGDYSEDYFNWTATSKVKIGDCPAKSIWEMTSQCGGAGCNGKNKIPSKCKSITPKVITDFNFDYDAM